MSRSVTITHSFEAAHRLPHLNGKCRSLHGHSWRVRVTVTAPDIRADGCVLEFGSFKHPLRDWIDTYLDHGAMLGSADPLRQVLQEQASKVFVFDPGWPTVEEVARLLGSVAERILDDLVEVADGVRVTCVEVAETASNTATWTP